MRACSESPREPRLVAVTGILSGEVFPLASPDVTFGRDAANTICCPDPALSRRHCLFCCGPDGWTLQDLDSSNGTFVNGVRVTTQGLTEGDRIAVGGSVFLFVQGPASPPSGSAFGADDVPTSTTRLALDETIYLKGEAGTIRSPRIEQGFRALLTISTVIHAVRHEHELRTELLRVLRQIVPAERAVIVLLRTDGEFEVFDDGPPDRPPLPISRRMLTRVLEERSGLLSRDVSVSRSYVAERGDLGAIRSLLCAPLVVRDIPLGAFCLTADERAAFDEDHLQLVTAAARLAAIAFDNVRHLGRIERHAARLQADLQLAHQLIGETPAMERVYERIGRVARSDATVLLTGESGTGKELAARAIHLNSSRARGPFVAINCAALSETLLESELFGHEKGAFTGAHSQKKGRLELADGGTVFLDEIGELAPALQSKLLRVLQEREVDRVGGTRPIKIDIRLISATNRNLAAEVRAARFREDLYFRLNVVAIEMPPLRDRRSDIRVLAEHFLERYAAKAGRRLSGFSPRALDYLTRYEWPGNVRELENAIERAVVLGSAEEILPEDLPEAIVDAVVAPGSPLAADRFHAAVVETKKREIVDAFRAAGGNYTETARALGVHPNYLHRLIRNLGLKATLMGGR